MMAKRLTIYLPLIIILGLVSNEVNAQARVLPILEAPVDARSAAMGGASLMSTQSNYLYINPTSILNQDEMLTISANGILYPRYKETHGRLKNGTISIGGKLFDRHVLYMGFRYQGGVAYKITAGPFDTQDNLEYNPFDWTIDLGYAYKIHDKFSLFTTLSFIQSYTGREAYAGAFALGANYRTCFHLGQPSAILNIAARIADFGTPLYYSSSESYLLPTKAELTADLMLSLSNDHMITTLVGARYYFLPAKSKVFQTNLGVEYTFRRLLSLRTGMQIGTSSTTHWTSGIGVKLWHGGAIDFAYLKGIKSTYSNRFVLTLSYNY